MNKYNILTGTAAGDYFLKLGKKIGEKRGIKRGIKIGEVRGQLNLLEKQFKQGILTEPQYQKYAAPLRRK